MRTLKYLFAYSVKQKTRVHKLDFIGSFLQAKINDRVFVNLDSIYADCFPEYSKYFGIDLILLKSMYGMNNYGKLFAADLTQWLLETEFVQSQCQMSIYSKYAPYGINNFVLSYVDDCVYCYSSEALGKWFM